MAGRSRSLQACPAGVEQIAHALTHKKLSREELGSSQTNQDEHVCGLSTTKKFCLGGKTDRKIFVKLCENLSLNWEEVAGIVPQAIAQTPTDDSAKLVEILRDRIRPHLQKRCGTMRVLDMSLQHSKDIRALAF